MDNWQEDLLAAMCSATDRHSLDDKVLAAARSLGFDYWAYGLRSALPVSNPEVTTFSNYPAAWQARYAERGYLDIDPSVHHGRRTEAPLVWSREVFASVPELWEEARANGLCVGWAKSTLDLAGVGSMLTLARSHDALGEQERAAIEPRMRWLAHTAHACFARTLAPPMVRALEVPLTDRETEVLRWTADGKTSADISRLLAISSNTVNFHIKNAVTKLDVANKTAAVVRAAMLGLLY